MASQSERHPDAKREISHAMTQQHITYRTLYGITGKVKQCNMNIIIIIIIIYFYCKWVFTQWRWYYNKAQHTSHKITQNSPNNEEHTTHNEYNADTINTITVGTWVSLYG
jgi:hypothetical protein